MEKSSNYSAERPLLHGAAAISKDAILIPRLKSSNVKRVVSAPVIPLSKYDGMRDLINIYIVDQAASALAYSYIVGFEDELLALRRRIVELESLTCSQKHQDVASTKSINQLNEIYKINRGELKSPRRISSVVGQPMHTHDDFEENVPPQTNEAHMTEVVLSATKMTLNCNQADAPLVRRSSRRASVSKCYTYPTLTKEKSVSEKTVHLKQEGKSSVKVTGNHDTIASGTLSSSMACRQGGALSGISESINSGKKERPNNLMASTVNNTETSSPIFDFTEGRAPSSDYSKNNSRNGDTANLESIAIWGSPSISRDSKIPRSDLKERYSAERDNFIECAEYSVIDALDSEQSNCCTIAVQDSTEVNLEAKISSPASAIKRKSIEQSPVTYIGNSDFEDSEGCGVLMFDSAINNINIPPDQQLKSLDKFDTDYASGGSFDDLLAHEDTFSTLQIVESSTISRRTSGRFRVKPKRYLTEILSESKAKELHSKKTDISASKRANIQHGRAVRMSLSGSARSDDIFKTTLDRNTRSSKGLDSDLKRLNAEESAQDREREGQHRDLDCSVAMRIVDPDLELSIDQHQQCTATPVSDDGTSPMKSEEEQNWQQYVDQRDQDYEESSGVMRWCCDADAAVGVAVEVDASKPVCAPSWTLNSADAAIKESIDTATAAAESSAPRETIYQRLGVVDKFIRSESTDMLLRDATTPSALSDALQIVINSRCTLSENELKSTGVAFVTILHSFISASARTSLIPLHSSLVVSLAAIIEHFSCPIEDSSCVEIKALNGKRSVSFCDVDGSSVTPPGKDCYHLPTLQTMKRLQGLIGRIEDILDNVQISHMMSADPGSDHKLTMMDVVLQCCVQLTDSVSSAAAARALRETVSLSVPSGVIAALAGLIGSEVRAAMMVNYSSLSGARTVLRHRTAWMATSVLRSQLRWLLDSPPAYVSVPSVCASNSLNAPRRSLLHKLVCLCEGGDALSASGASKKKRRKSDNTVIDHTILHPVEMTLSSLLAHALRQIYDAVIVAVDSGPSEIAGTGNINASATELLTAAVTTQEVNQVNAILEGMVYTHPQVFIERTFL
jgi:hypothetical protein